MSAIPLRNSPAALRDVAAASASRSRQASSPSEAQFFRIDEAALTTLPGLLGRFKDVLNTVEDFRAAYETAARRANLVPAGHSVIFTKTKFGWTIVIGPARAPASRNTPSISDVA